MLHYSMNTLAGFQAGLQVSQSPAGLQVSWSPAGFPGLQAGLWPSSIQDIHIEISIANPCFIHRTLIACMVYCGGWAEHSV